MMMTDISANSIADSLKRIVVNSITAQGTVHKLCHAKIAQCRAKMAVAGIVEVR